MIAPHRSRSSNAAPAAFFLAFGSDRKGFYKVGTKGGFHVVVRVVNRGGLIASEDCFHRGIHLTLVTLRIPRLGPESDIDPLFRLGLRYEGQELHKSLLLLQDR